MTSVSGVGVTRVAYGAAMFEYQLVVWSRREDEASLVARLNELGADCWEAVSMVPHGEGTPMPGMGGGLNVPDVAVLLKRRLGE